MNTKRESSIEWVSNMFDKNHVIYHQLFVPDEETTIQEANFILGFLNTSLEDQLLDVCCGSGRHLRKIAPHIRSGVGVDLSTAAINQAVTLTQECGVSNVQFVTQDALDFLSNPENRELFNCATLLFSSFGYYSDDKLNMKLLSGINSSLQNNGRFLLDISNKEFMLSHFKKQSSFSVSEFDISVARSFDSDSSRLSSVTTIKNSSDTKQLTIEMNVYSVPEIVYLLEKTGFVVEAISGDFTGNKIYTLPEALSHSSELKRLIIKAIKKTK